MIRIRAAKLEDAQAIGATRVECWRTSYIGIIPNLYLQKQTPEKWAAYWRRLLVSGGRPGAFVAVDEANDDEVVGYVHAGPSRYRDRRYTGEIYELYLDSLYHGLGVGRRLFERARVDLARRGHAGMMLWVLEENKTRDFYEQMGGKVIGARTDDFTGKKLKELAYGWPRIR